MWTESSLIELTTCEYAIGGVEYRKASIRSTPIDTRCSADIRKLFMLTAKRKDVDYGDHSNCFYNYLEYEYSFRLWRQK